MLKELAELRRQMEAAIAAGDKDLVFTLTRRYVRLFKEAWPNQKR